MKKIYIQIFIFFVIVIAAVVFFRNMSVSNTPKGSIPILNATIVPTDLNKAPNASGQSPSTSQDGAQNLGNQNNSSADVNDSSSFAPPLDRASERVTKKPFGIYITPKTSPVQPERFTGFHTGADFETFPEEANVDVTVHAVCAGKLLLKEYASGYGGVAVEACQLNNSPITVIYGHLKLASITPSVGTALNTGDTLGILGKGYSQETDGERKHLHLGFRKGTSINILGYVQTKSALSGWIDPCLYVCGK